MSPTLHPPLCQSALSKGFTAFEMLVVITIVSILAAIAAPNFRRTILNAHMRQTMGALESSFYLARSEAIKRGGNVILTQGPSETPECTLSSDASDWSCGWQICYNATGTADSCNAQSEILQIISAPTDVTIKSSIKTFNFNRWGTISNAAAGARIQAYPSNDATDPSARVLCISSGSRLRIVEGTSCGAKP